LDYSLRSEYYANQQEFYFPFYSNEDYRRHSQQKVNNLKEIDYDDDDYVIPLDEQIANFSNFLDTLTEKEKIKAERVQVLLEKFFDDQVISSLFFLDYMLSIFQQKLM
jgi:hypothetical protein